MTRTTDADLSRLDAARLNLARSLGILGWDLRAMDVDFAARKARIEIAREDRRVRLHVDGDRAFFERFRAEWIDVPTGRRGDRFLARRISVTFLGRTRGSTPREAVMLFAQYAVDNADVALPAGGVARQIAAAAGLR